MWNSGAKRLKWSDELLKAVRKELGAQIDTSKLFILANISNGWEDNLFYTKEKNVKC